MRIVLVALLAGCSFQHGSLGGGGGGSDAMPPGDDADMIDSIVIDARIDGATNVDTDGDGVFDNIDNCRLTPNMDQHNEDGDADGDKCDPCPQVANATTDTDGDKIGDACDPHPNAMGDVLVRFEPFTGNTLPSGWTVGAGALTDFTVAGDALTINATAGTKIALFDSGNKNHAIDVGVTLPSSQLATVFFTALTDVKSDVSEYFGCGLRIDTAVRELFAYSDPNFTTIGADPMASDAPAFPDTFRIVSLLADNSENCRIPSATNNHTMTGTTATNNRTFVGLRAGKIAAVVRYVAIYRF